MKKSKFNIFLYLSLIILVLVYIMTRYKDSVKQDYYELNSGFYLEKIDYFSQYSVVKKSGADYVPFISNVEAIASLEDGYLIKFKDKSEWKFIYLSANLDTQIISDNITDFDKFASLQELAWRKPWQVVEIKTISNENKLISQIVLILIIILGLYIIMKVFNLRRMSKTPLD